MRPNLVVIRAGDSSYHLGWGDLAHRPRDWDCYVNYYGARDSYPAVGEERIFRHGVTKFFGVADMLDEQPDILDRYRAILLLDDDIAIEPEAITRFFGIVARYDLQLAQPALRRGSFFNHEVTRRERRAVLRYTRFVEVMMPAFSAAALRACRDSLRLTVSGWGLDYVWPRLLGYPERGIAVVDAVPVCHLHRSEPRDGPFYRVMRRLNVDAEQELRQLLRLNAIDVPAMHVVRGTVRRAWR